MARSTIAMWFVLGIVTVTCLAEDSQYIRSDAGCEPGRHLQTWESCRATAFALGTVGFKENTGSNRATKPKNCYIDKRRNQLFFNPDGNSATGFDTTKYEAVCSSSDGEDTSMPTPSPTPSPASPSESTTPNPTPSPSPAPTPAPNTIFVPVHITSSTGCQVGTTIETLTGCTLAAAALGTANLQPQIKAGNNRFSKPKFCYIDHRKNTISFNPDGHATDFNSDKFETVCVNNDGATVEPTPSPTPAPTPSPSTSSPTPSPATSNPTQSPTPAPTPSPSTSSPTPSPATSDPTPSPTPVPTPSPAVVVDTPNPTPTPTPSPITSSPTPNPTPSPTLAPISQQVGNYITSPTGCTSAAAIGTYAECVIAATALNAGNADAPQLNLGANRVNKPQNCYVDHRKNLAFFNPDGQPSGFDANKFHTVCRNYDGVTVITTTGAPVTITPTPEVAVTTAAEPQTTVSPNGDYELYEVDGFARSEIEARPANGWIFGNSIAGYSGAGYFTWTGATYYPTQYAGVYGLLTYRVRISKPGNYRININKYHDDADTTESNDCWLQADGYDWEKVFDNTYATWDTFTNQDNHNAANHPPFFYLSGGDHEIRISARSHGFSIDYITITWLNSGGVSDGGE